MMLMNKAKEKQSGAVSLFVVVFATLLITVVVVSFIRIMINDEQQASTIDLSQSAYDSAQAGVEDGKRALLRYQNICDSNDQVACDDALANLESEDCNVALTGVVDVSGDEVLVQQNSNDTSLDQAYTCVKVELETEDYLGILQSGSSNVVPLISKQSFDRVLIEWFTGDDLGSGSNNSEVELLPASSSDLPLLDQSQWTSNTPSIMRAQLIQVGDNFTLSGFDNSSSGESNSNTVFLYPVGTTGAPSSVESSINLIARDLRRTPVGSLQPIVCSGTLGGGGYACRAEIVLPDPIGGGDRLAYMRLSAYYNSSNYRITLSNNGSAVARFDAVQPEIDSTGRANELFRRVKTRVELRDVNFPYPEAAVDITGDFCKDFLITNDPDDYVDNCSED